VTLSGFLERGQALFMIPDLHRAQRQVQQRCHGMRTTRAVLENAGVCDSLLQDALNARDVPK
jgi:hypothetical protein